MLSAITTNTATTPANNGRGIRLALSKIRGSTNNPNAAPDADATGSGMSNLNKFLAGFNPANPAAYLHIISIVQRQVACIFRADDDTIRLAFQQLGITAETVGIELLGKTLPARHVFIGQADHLWRVAREARHPGVVERAGMLGDANARTAARGRPCP